MAKSAIIYHCDNCKEEIDPENIGSMTVAIAETPEESYTRCIPCFQMFQEWTRLISAVNDTMKAKYKERWSE